MMSTEQVHAMMEDEKLLMREAEEIGARCVDSAKHISAEDVQAHTRRVIESLGISEAFLSGESCSESLADFLNIEWSRQPDFFAKREELENELKETRKRMAGRLQVFANTIYANMRTMHNIHIGRKGVIVRVYWPQLECVAFRSLRTAKVWNKKRIRAIRENHEQPRP